MNTIIAEPVDQKKAGPCSAYEAALRVTDHATRHLAVDIGGRHARAQQRAFAAGVNRLVRLLGHKLDGVRFSLRFPDNRPSARACRQSTHSAHTQLALQLTICRGNQIERDVALSHAWGRSLVARTEQTIWPHHGCGMAAGKTTVRETRASAVMSVHARAILSTPVSVYAGERVGGAA